MKYLPLILWSTLIFYLSSRPTSTLNESQDINTLLFKTAHVLAYAALYIFAVIAFSDKNKPPFKVFVQAVLYAVLFAISDEVHQLFVPTRSGKISDVFVDIVGIIGSYFFFRITNLHKILNKFFRNKANS